MRALVGTDWLDDNLARADVKVVDGSWRLPGDDRPAREDYLARRIPGAKFFDIDAISDRASPLPHMAAAAEAFARAVGELGISADDHVIVYDDQGLFSAPRVWWTFRLMGHERMSVLDGGLKKWMAEDRPLEHGPPSPSAPTHYEVSAPRERIASADDVLHSLEKGDTHIIDARSRARFEGRAPEPRPGLRAGAMPGAVNIPYTDLLAADGALRPVDEIAALLRAKGVGPEDATITTCGSGVTAAVVTLALEAAGHRGPRALYDGAWAEWGAADNAGRFPVAVAGD